MKPSELGDAQLIRLLGDEGRVYLDLEYESTGPGKFEGNENPGLAAVIYDRSLEGWNDDETGTVEWYFHVSLLGRFLLFENDQGFVTLEEFPSEEVARHAFDQHDHAYALWADDDGEA